MGCLGLLAAAGVMCGLKLSLSEVMCATEGIPEPVVCVEL
jgi:hypothetical protein